MAYFKYIPFIFLIIAALFIFEAINRYSQGHDPLPYILLAICGIAMFFIRRRSYKRYRGPKN